MSRLIYGFFNCEVMVEIMSLFSPVGVFLEYVNYLWMYVSVGYHPNKKSPIIVLGDWFKSGFFP